MRCWRGAARIISVSPAALVSSYEAFSSADRLIGCCVTGTLFRMVLNPTVSGETFLHSIQQQIFSGVSHSHRGAMTIAKDCTNCPAAHTNRPWHHHRTYFFALNLGECALSSLAVGDLGYAHVTRPTRNTHQDFYERWTPNDFDTETSSGAKGEIGFWIHTRSHSCIQYR